MTTPDEGRWAEIRGRYLAATETVASLCAEYSISPGALYARARRECWPKRSESKSRPETMLPERSKLVARLYTALHQQMTAIERRLSMMPAHDDPNPTATAERDARTLSTMVRTLEKLIELQAGDSIIPAEADRTGTEPDAESFRFEIVRRIEAFESDRKS